MTRCDGCKAKAHANELHSMTCQDGRWRRLCQYCAEDEMQAREAKARAEREMRELITAKDY